MRRSSWVCMGLMSWLAGATPACDRRGPEPEPPVFSPQASVPTVGSGPDPSAPEPAPTPDRPEPAPACMPAPAPEPIEPVETWAASGPPPTRVVEQVCTGLADRARRAIDELAGPCEAAEDCELVRIACPFGCTRAVSKRADRRRARVAFDRYMDECPTCKDKCPALPRALVCEEGTCRATAELPEAGAAELACPDGAR